MRTNRRRLALRAQRRAVRSPGSKAQFRLLPCERLVTFPKSHLTTHMASTGKCEFGTIPTYAPLARWQTALADLGFREQPIGRLGTFVNTLNHILTRRNPVPLQPEKNI